METKEAVNIEQTCRSQRVLMQTHGLTKDASFKLVKCAGGRNEA